MQHAFQIIDGIPKPALPILATANDVREVVQFLKKKPEGITIIEASDAVRKRLFDPRKIAAYELWGIISKNGDRMKLSELGREFARKLEPEARIYRVLLDGTPAYRGVLEWIYQRNLDLVTYPDVSEYWKEHFPEAVQQGEKTSEAQVVSFFHLCHAAEIGMATEGRKHQPSRLRVSQDELAAYIECNSGQVSEQIFAEASPLATRRPAAIDNPSPKPLMKVFISSRQQSGVAGSVQDALQVADIASEVVERETDSAELVSERTFQAMRRCNAGIIILSRADCDHDVPGKDALTQDVLMEIAAALVHFARRLVLLRCNNVSFPFKIDDFCQFELEGDELTWQTGLRLIKAVKAFKTSGPPIDALGELAN